MQHKVEHYSKCDMRCSHWECYTVLWWMRCFSFISRSFLAVLMCPVYEAVLCFESNSSAVFKGAIVRLARERSPQGRRINVEWLTSLCWRNEFSIHSQASRGETSFRKVNTIWQGPATDAKAQRGTASEDATLLHATSPLPPPSIPPAGLCYDLHVASPLSSPISIRTLKLDYGVHLEGWGGCSENISAGLPVGSHPRSYRIPCPLSESKLKIAAPIGDQIRLLSRYP